MDLFDKKNFERLVPVQIIGTQRSGSNLLRLMLNQIEEIFAPHPPHILTTFFPLLKNHGDLNDDSNFRQLVRDVCEYVNLNAVPWKDSILDPDFILSHCRERSLFEIYRKIYEVNAMHKKKPVWINKSMQNVYYIDLFEKKGFFPLLIHLVRDGRDVSLSFKRTIVGEKHIYHLANQWKNDQEIADYYVKRYGPARAIRIRYEDLLDDPAGEIRKICSFLNVPYSDRVFNYYNSDESWLAAKSGEMWVNLVKPIIRDNYNKYRSGLDRSEIEIFEAIAANLLQDYGYHVETDLNGQNYTFSEEEIQRFHQLNEQFKKEVMAKASPGELQKRIGQQQLISSIKERIGIS